jgi:hypothetical protein
MSLYLLGRNTIYGLLANLAKLIQLITLPHPGEVSPSVASYW